MKTNTVISLSRRTVSSVVRVPLLLWLLSASALAEEGKRHYPVEAPPHFDRAALEARPAPPKAAETVSRIGIAPTFEYVAHLPRDYQDYGFRPVLLALHPPRGYAREEYEAWRGLLLERPYAFAAPQVYDRRAGRAMDAADAATLAAILFEMSHFASADTGATLLFAPLAQVRLAADLLAAAPEILRVGFDATLDSSEARREAERALEGMTPEAWARFAGRPVDVYLGAESMRPGSPGAALVARLHDAGATILTPRQPAAPPAVLTARAWLLASFERSARP